MVLWTLWWDYFKGIPLGKEGICTRKISFSAGQYSWRQPYVTLSLLSTANANTLPVTSGGRGTECYRRSVNTNGCLACTRPICLPCPREWHKLALHSDYSIIITGIIAFWGNYFWPTPAVLSAEWSLTGLRKLYCLSWSVYYFVIRATGCMHIQGSNRDWKPWKWSWKSHGAWTIGQKSWNFAISHGMLPILPLNGTKFVFIWSSLRN